MKVTTMRWPMLPENTRKHLASTPVGAWLVVSVGVIGVGLWSTGVKFDWPLFAFLALAISPWLATLVEKLKFGDFELSLRAQQKRQQDQIDAAIRFLLTEHISKHELLHLQKLVADAPFHAELHPDFLAELQRLLKLGLIDRRPGYGFGTLERAQPPRNVKEHFEITDAGRHFLSVRDALLTEEQRQNRKGRGS